MAQTLYVSGASGQLAQRVLTHLVDHHRIPPALIVAGTRKPEKLEAWAAKGVKVRKADFEDPASLAAALKGVDRMLLISTDAIDRPGRRLAQHKAAVEAAKQAGVRHVVYTSMPNPDRSPVTFAPDHLGTEQALEASGLGWTILRMSWYMDGLLGALPPVLAAGQWVTAAGSGKVSHVTREDCARAAAAALASDETGNVRYDVTGPEKYTTAELAATASRVTGKPIEVVQVSNEEFAQGKRAAGLPEFVVALIASIEAHARAGCGDVLSDAVVKLTGKPPQSVSDFLAANKAALQPAR